MSSRSISLDQSALSPKEYQSYNSFISEFRSFTSSRAGRLRFAEAAQFLRGYFPFETAREDEIRSFFPQKVQLGEIDEGCVLAILRLLSHINNHKCSARSTLRFQLYRDLIFLQTEPLPSLPQSQLPSYNPLASSDPPQSHHEKNIPLPNPFRSLDLTKPRTHQPPNSTILPPPKSASPPPTSSFEKPQTIPHLSASSSAPTLLQPPSDSDPRNKPSLSSGCHPNPTSPGLKNPFRHSSISRNTNSDQTLYPSSPPHATLLPSPRIPPRPVIPLVVTTNTHPPEIKSEEDSSSQTPMSTKALPPPKHYSQRLGKHVDSIQPQNDQALANQPDPPPSANQQSISPDNRAFAPSTSPYTPGKIIHKNKILPGLQVNQVQANLVDQTENIAHHNPVMSSRHPLPSKPSVVRHNDSKHVSSILPLSSSSEFSKSATPPPIKPTRPDKSTNAFQHQNTDGIILLPQFANIPPTILTRSRTLNHNRRVAPPLPPPRKRRESLHVHNPDSLPLDQLFQLTSNDSNESSVLNMPFQPTQTSDKTWINNSNKRSVSNSVPSSVPKTLPNYQSRDRKKIINEDESHPDPKLTTEAKDFSPRRSVSLLVQKKPTTTVSGVGTTTTTTESVIEQLRALEVGLRHDGKQLVKEVKEGWTSRHGKKEERVPLVTRKADLSADNVTTVNTNINHHTKNNDIHYNHLGGLISSRWKVSNRTNDNLHMVDNNLDPDDDQSSDSLSHDQNFCNPNTWHQLP